MRRRDRIAAIVVAGALVALAALGTGCGGKKAGEGSESTSGLSGKPVRIGAVLSLTGTYAGLGVPERNAIEMLVAEINKSGGIEGRPLEVITEDDATDPQKAAAAVAKLIDKDAVVAVIGATGTGQTMAMRGDVDRAQVPQVSMAGGSVITDKLDPLVFQTPWPNRVVVPFTLKYLKDQGITRIALISDSGGYGKDGHDVTVKDAAAAGITIVADEWFNPGDTDMTGQLTKIKGKTPQAIWLWSAGKEAAIVAKNLRQLDPKGDIRLVGAPGNGRREFIEGAAGAADGFTFAAGKILAPESYGAGTQAFGLATKFSSDYEKAYGKAPDIFAGHAYDALKVVVDALKRAGADADPAKLRDAIEKTNGLVGMGGTFNYSPTDHNGLTEADLVIYRIEGGAWKLAK